VTLIVSFLLLERADSFDIIADYRLLSLLALDLADSLDITTVLLFSFSLFDFLDITIGSSLGVSIGS
jgi:hypothetical protein